VGQIIITTKKIAKKQIAREKAKGIKSNSPMKNPKPKKANTKKSAIDPNKIDCRNCTYYKQGICHVISAKIKKQHKVYNSKVATECTDFKNRNDVQRKQLEAADKTRKVGVYIYECPTGHVRFELQEIIDNPLPYCDKCYIIRGVKNHLTLEKKTKMPLEAIERKQQQLKKFIESST
jgi:hypothetical protein